MRRNTEIHTGQYIHIYIYISKRARRATHTAMTAEAAVAAGVSCSLVVCVREEKRLLRRLETEVSGPPAAVEFALVMLAGSEWREAASPEASST